MAFQNNSGGIILDATLTDIGRKYMVQGKFKVVKFTLGDDEIDYGMMAGDPSTDGHAIPNSKLPPLLEAFSNENAVIVHGLMSLPRPDILFMPVLKINSKIKKSIAPSAAHDIIYLSINKETTRKLKSDAPEAVNSIIEQGTLDKKMIVIESGIEVPSEEYTTDLMPTKENKFAYLFNMSLYDAYFILYADSRFIENVLSSPSTSKFYNNSINTLTQNLGPLVKNPKLSFKSIDDNFESYRIDGIDNMVCKNPYDTGSRTLGNEYSAITGPRGTIFGFNVELKDEILNAPAGDSNHSYTLFGTLSNDLFGTGNLYDFIDTTIYIEGLASSARQQVHLRIVRYVDG
tara:strand:+ start:2052 stop:3086 length:1035 start_codon:yes stop_codon:yes gene_type:complete